MRERTTLWRGWGDLTTSGSFFAARSSIQPLPPLALQRERRPVIRRAPPDVARHLDLGRAQCSRRALLFLEHFFVEFRHQLGCPLVADAPQADHDPRGASVHETTGQADQTLSFDLLAETALTRAEHHDLGGQIQVVDVVGPEESVLRLTLLVECRENKRRESRALGVQVPVGGEMDIPVRGEPAAGDQGLAGSEIQGSEIGGVRFDAEDAVRFLPREWQPWNKRGRSFGRGRPCQVCEQYPRWLTVSTEACSRP